MAQDESIPADRVTTVVPSPVPASKHIAVVPFAPTMHFRPTLLQRIRGWFQ